MFRGLGAIPKPNAYVWVRQTLTYTLAFARLGGSRPSVKGFWVILRLKASKRGHLGTQRGPPPIPPIHLEQPTYFLPLSPSAPTATATPTRDRDPDRDLDLDPDRPTLCSPSL